MSDYLRNEDRAIVLIEAYKNLPVLWDPNCKDYNSKEKRNQAYIQLANVCKCEVEAISQKLKNLRTYFIRETKKLNKLREAGKHVRRSKWFAYEHMTFLLNVKQSDDYYEFDSFYEEQSNDQHLKAFSDEETDDNQQPQLPTTSQNGINFTEPLTEIHIKSELEDAFQEDNSDPLLENQPSPAVPDPVPQIQRKRRNSGEEPTGQFKKRKNPPPNNISSVNKCVDKLLTKVTNLDSFALFGELIAGKLRNLNNVRAQAMAENEIQNVLFKYEMKCLPECDFLNDL